MMKKLCGLILRVSVTKQNKIKQKNSYSFIKVRKNVFRRYSGGYRVAARYY